RPGPAGLGPGPRGAVDAAGREVEPGPGAGQAARRLAPGAGGDRPRGAAAMNRRYVPGLADDVSKLRIFSTYEPRVHAGDDFTVRVEQEAKTGSGPNASGISVAGDGMRVHFKAEGPHQRLAQTEVVGCYPAPGSDNSPDEFMCHVALTRR